MKKTTKLLVLLVTTLLFASCNSGDGLQYMPFLDEEGGNWGMISTDGDVLFTKEFKEMPTVAMNDRFFAKNGDGKWELYATGSKPTVVGKDMYEEAGAFIEDVAPVVMKGKPIQFIDKEGNVAFTLGKVNGKAIEECTNFSDGVAIFKAGKYYGCINSSGKIIVEPQYLSINPANDGKMLAVDKKYENVEDRNKGKYTVLSTSGKVISEIPAKNFTDIGTQFVDGALMVEDNSSDGTRRKGLIDENGEYIVKPSSKIHNIKDIKDGMFIFYDGDRYGVMDFKGEVVIRAKYRTLHFANKKGLFWAREDRDKSGFVLINDLDETISKEEFYNVQDFHGSYAAVQESENNWIFVNDKGEDQKIKTDIYHIIDDNTGDQIFHSQYFDTNSFINKLDVQPNGFLGLNLTMNAQNIINSIKKIEGAVISTEPSDHTYESYIESDLTINKAEVVISTSFDEYFVSPIESTTTDYYGYTYTETTGYNYKNINPNKISLEIKREGLIIGHMSEVTSKLIEKTKAFGKVVKENKNAVVVQVGSYTYFVANSGQSVYIICGHLDAKNIDISQYEDVTEDSDVSVDIENAIDTTDIDIAADTVAAQ